MSTEAKAVRLSILAAGAYCLLLVAPAMLAAAENDDWLVQAPTARARARNAEFERRGQPSARRVDRRVKPAAYNASDSRTDEIASAYSSGHDSNRDDYESGESTSRGSSGHWSPKRKDIARRPSYFEDLVRRREAHGSSRDFEPEYGPRLANFDEELPPGHEHPHMADGAYEDDDPYTDQYIESEYGSDEFYGGESCGPDGCNRPYGGYSVDTRPGYFIPPGNWYWWDDLTVFGGVHAFKGPLDQGRNGNFGFHEGINWGGPLWDYMQIGYQVGGQVTHSNFHGDQVFTPNDRGRTQYFITAGLFHRADGCGWQCGVVADWLQDSYYTQFNFTQIRTEISYVTMSQHEFGVWATAHTDKSTIPPEVMAVTTLPSSIRSADMFSAFWRKKYGDRGEGRLWAGSTSGGHVIFGGNVRAPLTKYFLIESNFNYIAADGNSGSYDNTAESWSTVVNLVWYPGWSACRSEKHPYRPLFNVANNSTFMVAPNQNSGRFR